MIVLLALFCFRFFLFQFVIWKYNTYMELFVRNNTSPFDGKAIEIELSGDAYNRRPCSQTYTLKINKTSKQ